jgi:hypothetical protein
MEEIFKQTLTAIPQYLINFFNLLGSPIQFPISRLPQEGESSKENLTEALKFVLISFTIIGILSAWKNNPENPFKDFGVEILTSFIQMPLFVFANYFAWKMFGGKKPFLDYFIIYAYQYGVIFIIITVFTIISEGYLKISDKALYDNLIQTHKSAEFNTEQWGNINYKIKWCIWLIGFTFTLIWGYTGWVAYSMINKFNQWRSIGAMIIATIFSVVAASIAFLIVSGIK